MMKSHAMSKARGKEHVARQPHPLPEQGAVVEGAAARIRQAMLMDGIELRPADGEEIERDPQQQPQVAEPERLRAGMTGRSYRRETRSALRQGQ